MLKTSLISGFFISIAGVSFASESDEYENKHVKSAKEQYLESVDSIQDAFARGDTDEVIRLINVIEKTAKWAGVNSQVENFYHALSQGDDIHAKQLADDIINNGGLSYKEIAFVHNAFGSHYFQTGELDKARIEFEKILELPVNKKE